MDNRAEKWIGNMRGWSNQTYGVRHLPLKQSKLTEASNLASWHASTVLAVVRFFSHLWWESFKRHTAATFLRPQKVSWIFFDLIWCAQKSFVPISSLSYRHHRTCRSPSHLGQLVRGGQRRSRGRSRTKILQERCVNGGLYTSYCFSLAGSTKFLCCS